MPRAAKTLTYSLLFLLAGVSLAQPAAAQGFLDRLFGRNSAPPAAPGAAVILPGYGPVYGQGPGLGAPFILDRRDSLELGRRTVVVFVAGGCPQCFEAVEDARTISAVGVEVMDVSANSMARDAFNILGSRGLPTTVAGSQMLVGRDPNMARIVAARAGMDARQNTGN